MADDGSNKPEELNDAITGFAREFGKAAAAYQSAMNTWLEAWRVPQAKPPAAIGEGKNEKAAPSIDPAKAVQHQMDLMRDYQALWAATTQKLLSKPADAVIEPEKGDYRFRDPAWSENPIFDFIKQSYLLNARWMRQTLGDVEGLDADSARKLDFYGRAIVDAMAPSNFPMTNPVVLRETAETKGENLIRGFQNFMEDSKNGGNGLRPRHTDMTAFEVGKNIAVTPGAVVYRGELFELLQYTPTTEKVHKVPLLIIPPWINKFYILDLRPDNSFIRWAVAQGYTVFVMSWVNPDERLRDKSFADYIKDGIFAALDAVEKATGEKQVNTIGYCIGGTLLAMTLALMAARGDDRIKSATFFAAQVDFTDAGDLRVFTDEEQVGRIEKQVNEKGYLEGGAMAATFNMLRANDLIWSFVVNNYLLGKEPQAFDLLYWNADPTRFPAKLLIQYLRGMYIANSLSTPGGITIDGTPIDLGKIEIPTYIQASREDHIAPMRSVYKAMHLFGGKKRFMLAGSGHIAGVVNPPEKKKYQHWINDSKRSYADVDAWLADAIEHPGSWWNDWDAWISKLSDGEVPARTPGDRALKVLEPAPGSYVKVKG